MKREADTDRGLLQCADGMIDVICVIRNDIISGLF